MATISDVAARAGVSTATVSRALNGKETVATELSERVLAAATELGYRLHGPARSLRRQETAVFALIISDVENPFFTAIARGVEDAAQAAGYSVVLCNSDDDPDKERRYVDIALQERVAGVIVSPTGRSDSVEALGTHAVPAVAIDRPLPVPGGDTVLVDTRGAAATAVRHLVEQGYQRIGCVTGPSGVRTADDRLAGYRDGLREPGAHPHTELVRRAEFKPTGGRQATSQLFTNKRVDGEQSPDALLVANSAMAIGALETLAELGLRPGSDVGVVAFDDAPWATLLASPLSVVSQPAHDIGTLSTQLLLERITEEREEDTTTTLSAELVVRASSLRAQR